MFKVVAALFLLAQTAYFVLEIRRLRQEMYNSQEGLWRNSDVMLAHILHHEEPDKQKRLDMMHWHIKYLKGE